MLMNKKINLFFLYLLFFLSITDLMAHESKNHNLNLNQLFIWLKNDKKFDEAKKIEYKIWHLWSEHHEEIKFTKLMMQGTKLMSNADYLSVYAIFTKIIEKDPNWAEAWNKRTTVLFLMENYEESLKDIDETFNRENNHFGTLSGQSLIFIQLNEYKKAIKLRKKFILS